MQGWIKLYRQACDSELYFSERFTRMQAWIDLLLLATHKQQTVFLRGVEVHLLPGELCYSQLSLAKRWKWNFKTVKNFLSSLEKREMLETRTNNVTTVISIRNWSKYQGNGEQNGDQNGEQKETRTETNKNVKECGKMERERNSLPENAEEVKAYFRERNFVNADTQAVKFFAHFEEKHWTGVQDWRLRAEEWNAGTLEYNQRHGNGSAFIPKRPIDTALGDETWKAKLISCSACGQVHPAGEMCREEMQKA